MLGLNIVQKAMILSERKEFDVIFIIFLFVFYLKGIQRGYKKCKLSLVVGDVFRYFTQRVKDGKG